MERKLASIQIVKEIEDVITKTGEVAQNLVLLSFEDIAWRCVAKRGQFEVGDFCIYIEVSTVVPDDYEFEFMKRDKFIVKTKKFVGTTLSQGLAMPLDILDNYEYSGTGIILAKGADVSEILGVKRYEPLEQYGLSGPARGEFPIWLVPKTDEIRLQSAPLYLELMRGLPCTATMKLDGTSATFWWDGGELHAASRNLELRPGDTVYWKIAEKYNLAEKLSRFHTWIIQGEIVGPGIQKNPLGLRSPEFYIFNIWDKAAGDYVDQDTLELFGRLIDLPTVPIVKRWPTFNATVEELLQVANANYPDTQNPIEGIVVRPTFENLYDARLGRLSFKVINDTFALQEV